VVVVAGTFVVTTVVVGGAIVVTMTVVGTSVVVVFDRGLRLQRFSVSVVAVVVVVVSAGFGATVVIGALVVSANFGASVMAVLVVGARVVVGGSCSPTSVIATVAQAKTTLTNNARCMVEVCKVLVVQYEN